MGTDITSDPGRLPTGIVVVAGATHGGLSIIRSLGRRGLRVVVITYNADEHALASKYVDEWAICPHPSDDEKGFIEFLLERSDVWRGALILETNDHYATALSRNKDRLVAHYRMLVPDWEVARLFIEKDRTYRLAEQCGVDFPRFHQPESEAELESVIDDLRFPVMIKPVRSHEFVAVFGTKLFIVESAAELRDRFGRCLDAGQDVVVAEIIPGTDYKTLERVTMYIDSAGEVSTELYTTKLRQTPPMFGMNKVSMTTPVYEEVREQTLRMLQDCEFRGHAGVEFKRDPRDGTLKLIEINIRLLADTQLSVDAGVDLPWIVYQDLVFGTRTRVTGEPGVYFIHLLTDVFEFFTKERDRLRYLRRFVEPYRADRRSFAFYSRDDPGPFRAELAARARRSARKVRRKLPGFRGEVQEPRHAWRSMFSRRSP